MMLQKLSLISFLFLCCFHLLGQNNEDFRRGRDFYSGKIVWTITGMRRISNNSLYIDGKEVINTSTSTRTNGVKSIIFGGRTGKGTNPPTINMKLDNIRFYDRTLTDTEVSMIDNEEKL